MLNNDIHWILNSPGLIRHDYCLKAKHFFQPQHATQSTVRTQLVEQENYSDSHIRLGIYYENLVGEIIRNLVQPTEIKRNIQIHKDKATLGEFDFLFRSGKTNFHLECAVKYYLRVGNGSELAHFIGPGKRDRLDKKWQRLINHQIVLSDTAEGKQYCHEQNLTPDQLIILLQGYLFHPWHEWLSSNFEPQLNAVINPSHLQGWWLRETNLNLLDQDGCNFSITRKPYWLHPKTDVILDYDALSYTLAELLRPELVIRLNEQYEEIDRGFVVPKDW